MFAFSLESLLKLREIEKEKRLRSLAAKLTILNKEKSKINKYCKETSHLLAKNNMDREDGILYLSYYSFLNNYLHNLSIQKEDSTSRLKNLSKDVESERTLLRKSEIAVKSLERLKESRYKEYLYCEAKKHQQELDDQYSQQAFLKKRKNYE